MNKTVRVPHLGESTGCGEETMNKYTNKVISENYFYEAKKTETVRVWWVNSIE